MEKIGTQCGYLLVQYEYIRQWQNARNFYIVILLLGKIVCRAPCLVWRFGIRTSRSSPGRQSAIVICIYRMRRSTVSVVQYSTYMLCACHVVWVLLKEKFVLVRTSYSTCMMYVCQSCISGNEMCTATMVRRGGRFGRLSLFVPSRSYLKFGSSRYRQSPIHHLRLGLRRRRHSIIFASSSILHLFFTINQSFYCS